MKFRKLFIDTTTLDPYSRAFTLPSVGQEFFRAKTLNRHILGITPITPYSVLGTQSAKANAWLDVQELKYNEEIKREFRIGPYHIDGVINKQYFDQQTNKQYDKMALEFLGCYYHGCAECGYDNPEEREKVERRREYLLKRNIYPLFIKECEWEEKVKTSPFKRYYKERVKYHNKLKKNNLYVNPRKALHGGRCNNFRFSREVGANQQILYYDVVSLYPYVMSRRPYPVGHPIVYQKDFPPIKEVFGFVSCKILPPNQLHFPVLPAKINGKLVFTLCSKCAKTQNQHTCQCSDDERCLVHTFCSNELLRALELGYKIIEIYEVLHYPTQCDDIFKPYIDTWYKIKAENSGYPKGLTEDLYDKFIKDFKDREGIELNKENIQSNPGLRNIAKLMLNSLWGKFAQRPNQPETKICKNFQEFYSKISDPNYEILGDQMINNMILLNYKLVDDATANPRNTCVAIASFVTSWARLKLHEEIHKIHLSNPGSVDYVDTDSVIFMYEEGKYKPSVNNFLGEMTDEIIEKYGVGAKIKEFYSTGPKVYGMNIQKPDGTEIKEFKAKGLTQTIESSEVMNFEVIKEKAINKANSLTNDATLVPQQQFQSNKRHDVTTRHLNKQYRVTSDKRRIVGNDTLPYGWVDEEIGICNDDEIDEELDDDQFAALIIGAISSD